VGTQKVAAQPTVASQPWFQGVIVCRILGAAKQKTRELRPATRGARDTEGGPRAAISRVLDRRDGLTPYEHETTSNDTMRSRAAAYWMRTGTPKLLSTWVRAGA